MKQTLVLLPLVMVLCAGVCPAAAPAADQRAAVQVKIESGADLPDRAREVLFRARTRLEDGDAAGAAAALDRWLAGHPDRDHHLLRFERALARLALDEPDSALGDLRRAVALEPRFGRAWLKLGEVAYGQGAYDLAAEGFGRGSELTPAPDPELRHYQGVCLVLAGKPDDAVRVLAQLVRDQRAHAELAWYRALIAADLQSARPGAAAPYLDAMVEDFASDPEAWDLAATYAASRRQYRAGAVYLSIEDYLKPLGADKLRRLGDLYGACGVPLQAARCYERALARAQAAAAEDTSAVRRWRQDQERLASFWLAAHRPERARQGLQAAVAADPEFGKGYLLMGYSALRLNRPALARQDLDRALAFPEVATEAERILNSLAGKPSVSNKN